MWKKTSQMYKNRESVDVEKACVGAVRTAQLICSGAKKNKKTINCDTKFASDTFCTATSLLSPRHPRHQKQPKWNEQ